MSNEENVWSDIEIKRFWDFESRFKEHYFTYANGNQLVNLFRKYISEKSILDYGAGDGFFIDFVLRNGSAKNVSAIENSEESIRIITSRYGDNPIFADVLSLEEVKNIECGYDSVFSFEVVEHLGDPQLEEFFSNMRIIMKKADSHLIISTPNDEKIRSNYVCCPSCGKVFHRWQHVRSWNRDSLCERLQKEGFEIEAAFTTEVSKYTNDYMENHGEIVDYKSLESEKGSNLFVISRLINTPSK